MNMDFANSQQAYRLRRHSQLGFSKLGYALILVTVVIAVGAIIKFGPMPPDHANGGQSNAAIGPREVDFGFVELKPGLPTPITSYKFGGNMVLYAGEVVSYQVVGPAPLPAIDLRIGQDVHTLSGADGKLLVAGPANQALPAAVVAQNLRHSLPGGAPPRVSVKVQVQGAARPIK